MKYSFILSSILVLAIVSCNNETAVTAKSSVVDAITPSKDTVQPYFIDVHDVEPGKVTPADVAGAHEKDLATQSKYGVTFHKYWLDQAKGKIYCLSQANNAAAIESTHRDAHGLMP